MASDDAQRQWNSAAPGWAKWEHAYASWLAPATEVLLDQTGVTAGGRVIDIATGAGDQARVAARRVGPSGSVLATDIAPTMLEYVAARARDEGLATITTHACSADALPAERGPFDSAICRLGLMLFPNPAAVVASVRDVLRPGGRFGALVIAEPSANPYLADSMAILRRHAGKPAPVSGPGIFALAVSTKLTALLEDQGFDHVSLTTIDLRFRWESVDDAIAQLREGAGVYRAVIDDQSETVQKAAWAEVRASFLRYGTEKGRLVFPGRVHVAGGQKPV